MRNNIISAPKLAGQTCYTSGCSQNVDSYYNIYHGTTLLNGKPVQGFSFGPNDRYVAPGFVSSTDFQLTAGSAAVDTGSPLAAYTFDLLENPFLGTVDRGAYERQ